MNLVSIIVPVFNVENYLDKCIKSLMGQSYQDTEIILIDDGSTDNSLTICEEYSKIDDRIKVIHKLNGGLSSARNAGLNVAIGDYICFVDSDDYLESDAVEKLITTIQSANSSICCMKSYIVDDKYNILKNQSTNTLSVKSISSNEYLKMIFQRVASESVCDKMFSAKVIKDYRFNEERLNEDFLFLTSVLLDNNFMISLIDYSGYNYYQRINSISRKRFGKSTIDAVYNADEVAFKICKTNYSLITFAGAYAAYSARAAIISMSKIEYKKEQKFVQYCNNVIKNNKKHIRGSFMKSKDKLFCYLNILLPKIAKFFADIIVK